MTKISNIFAAAGTAAVAGQAAPSTNNSNRGNQNNQGATTDYVRAEFWMNIGTCVDMTNPSTGETTREFIPLNRGIPLDTIEDASIKNSDTDEHKARMGARDQLRDYFVANAKASLKPGESTVIEVDEVLAVQIKRIADASAQVPAGESPLLSALARKLAPAAAA